jgi:hypothetical protein
VTDESELRAQLARLDPTRRPETADLVDNVTAEQIRERAMQTIDTPTTEPSTPQSRWRRPAVLIGAAASVVAVVIAAVVIAGGDSSTKPKSTLALQAPGGGVTSSCIVFDVAVLRQAPVAFAGTATDVGADTVTLDVDHWYKGGSAEQVTISNPTGATAGAVALDGIEFAEGERYLITATEGNVNLCGFSGPASAELEQAFTEAFGS